MKYYTILIALIVAAAVAEKYGLVFGAKDNWNNYSITSNPCRAYDDMIKAGIKPENIIYMTYTTDLKHKSNPFPGMIFTDPADNTDGDWAKYGCFEHVDYTDKEINKKVFLAILSGDAETVKEETGKENPKVVNFTPDDTIFTYYIDHGNIDIIAVGNDHVNSEEFIKAITTAHEKKLYGKWLFFMEACYSGSMFVKLPSDLDFYVMTASDNKHSAYMSNCPPNDYIEDKHLKTCLSGLWDNIYMTYAEDHPDCTVGEIVDYCKAEVAKSSKQTVSDFGDMTFRDMKLSDFLGPIATNRMRRDPHANEGVVEYSQVPLHLAKWEAIRAAPSDREAALKNYAEMAITYAKREVAIMRLGSKLLNEKAADKAMKTSAESYSADCVRELSMSLMDKCGFEMPFTPEANNMLKNICRPGMATPNVDFNDICL